MWLDILGFSLWAHEMSRSDNRPFAHGLILNPYRNVILRPQKLIVVEFPPYNTIHIGPLYYPIFLLWKPLLILTLNFTPHWKCWRDGSDIKLEIFKSPFALSLKHVLLSENEWNLMKIRESKQKIRNSGIPGEFNPSVPDAPNFPKKSKAQISKILWFSDFESGWCETESLKNL